MVVLKRHRRADGTLVGYTVRDRGRGFFLSKEAVEQGGYAFSNADILNGGEVRAKRGKIIKTEVEKLPVHMVEVPKHGALGQGSVQDFYGREYIEDCRRIRESARSGRLRLSMERHKQNNGDNVLLFDIIRGCGYGVEEFVIGYLSCLQPYSMQEFTNHGANNIKRRAKRDDMVISNKDRIWLVDLGYRYCFLVKVHFSRDNRTGKLLDQVVVSFHESSQAGKYFKGGASFLGKQCAVFVDSASKSGDWMTVSYTVQRGFLRSSFTCDVRYCVNGVALVWYQDIARRFVSMLNDYLLRIYGVYQTSPGLQGHLPLVTEDGLGNLSFMANGVSVLNTLCLMIDLYANDATALTRQALVGVSVLMLAEVPEGLRGRYLADLQTKYGMNYGNVLYLAVVRELGGDGV